MQTSRGAAALKHRNLCCGSLESAAFNELVAQLVEQRPFKAWVLGSIPSELTTLGRGFPVSTPFLSSGARPNSTEPGVWSRPECD